MEKKCIFCEEYKNKNFASSMPLWYFRWDNVPIGPGHGEIVPIRHVELYEELDNDELITLRNFIKIVKEYITGFDLMKLYKEKIENPSIPNSVWFCKKAIEKLETLDNKIDAWNIGINQGVYAGQTIPHLHIHIIPRYEGDVEDPVGGIRHMIPGMGNYRIERT